MDNIIEVKNLTKEFEISSRFGLKNYQVKAVNDVSFAIKEGETFGLVGESGCGKTTTGRLILRLINPSSGDIFLEGKNINKISNREMKNIRKVVQVIFQNPYSALDPKMTVLDILSEPLAIHRIVHKYQYEREVKRLLSLVGLSETDKDKFPHEFSGGQRQRIGIARAIATRPKFIICDEPVSALDVSVQSQILNLLNNLQSELKVSYLFIAHGLNIVKHMSNRIGVMYLGKIIEIGYTDELFNNPLHPYTKVLLASVPSLDLNIKREKQYINGELPSPLNIPSGCAFHPRCRYAMEICKVQLPQLMKISANHEAACHIVNKQIVQR